MSTLTEFYREVARALATGEHPKWFDPDFGLCSNADAFGLSRSTLVTQLEEHGLDPTYPFNKGMRWTEKREDYHEEAVNGTVYSNPRRLAWIEDRANDGLPDGLFFRHGQFQFQCRSCTAWAEWSGDPDEFELDYHTVWVCGGSPRCCP